MLETKEIFYKTWSIAISSGVCVDEFDPWYECFKASTIWPIGSRDGEMIGAVLLHGMPDQSVMMHVVVEPEHEGRWLNKKILKAFRGWKPGVPVVALAADKKRENALRHVGFIPMDKEPVLGLKWFIRK